MPDGRETKMPCRHICKQFKAKFHVSGSPVASKHQVRGARELRLEGIVSKRLTAPYKSGPCKSWIKEESGFARLPADHRWDVLSREARVVHRSLAV